MHYQNNDMLQRHHVPGVSITVCDCEKVFSIAGSVADGFVRLRHAYIESSLACALGRRVTQICVLENESSRRGERTGDVQPFLRDKLFVVMTWRVEVCFPFIASVATSRSLSYLDNVTI